MISTMARAKTEILELKDLELVQPFLATKPSKKKSDYRFQTRIFSGLSLW